MKAGVRARYNTKFKSRKKHADAGLYKVKKGMPGWVAPVIKGDEEE
jgi:hypothetical protein